MPPPAAPRDTSSIPWIDPMYRVNRNRVPYEQVQPWEGQHVAWNWEGTAIVAGAPTTEELVQELDRLGIHWSHVVFDYVDRPGEANL